MAPAAALIHKLRRVRNPIREMVSMALGMVGGDLSSTLDEVVNDIMTVLAATDTWKSYIDMVYEEQERIQRLFLHPQTEIEHVQAFVAALRQHFPDARLVAQPSAAPDHLGPGDVRLDTSGVYYTIDIPIGKMLDKARDMRARGVA